MIKGRYFKASSAQPHSASLSWRDGVAIVEIDGEPEPVTAKVRTVGALLGRVPRRIEFEGGALFEAPFDADLDGIQSSETSALGKVARIESSWTAAVVMGVCTVALIIGFFRIGLPWLSDKAAFVTPPSIAAAIDAGTLQTLDTAILEPSALSQERQKELQAQFDALAGFAVVEGLPLNLQFRSAPLVGPNAFALPGGTVVLLDELVGVAKSDDEIAGVLAHEIGHVERRHPLQMLYRVAGIGVMVSVVAGDASQMVDQVVAQASTLQQLSYSRALEEEADRQAVALMLKVKRDPIAFVTMIERITAEFAPSIDKDAKTSWLDSHPSSADRRATVEAYARSLGWGG